MEIINPGGTGSPILPISDKFAPFPPKVFLGFFIFFSFFLNSPYAHRCVCVAHRGRRLAVTIAVMPERSAAIDLPEQALLFLLVG